MIFFGCHVMMINHYVEKQMKYIFYQFIIHYVRMEKSVTVKYYKILFHVLYFQCIKLPILILKLFTLWILNQYFHLIYQLNALTISDIKTTLL
jgi:hypothetical protein